MDLDQGGRGFQRIRTYLGPSLGWTEEYIQPMTDITTVGTYVVQPGDSVLLVEVAGLVTIQLPDVRVWMQQTAGMPATGFERSITVKDQGGNAANFNITIAPVTGQAIDNVFQPILIVVNRASSTLYPMPDLTGWYVKSTAVGGPGANGDVFKTGNNTFTGTNIFNGPVSAPTKDVSDNSISVATTAYVKGQNYVSQALLNSYATLESPSLTGTPRAPTPSNAINDGTIATTAYVKSNLAQYQPVDDDLTNISALTGVNVIYYRSGIGVWSPVIIGTNLTFTGGTLSATGGGGGGGDVFQSGNNTFTGINVFNGSTSAVTVISSDNSTKVATTGFVKAQGYLVTADITPLAPKNNPVFTGNPQAPTPLTSDSSISIATTAYVKANLASYQPLDGDLTAIAALTGTNTIYYRSAPDIWSPVTFSGLTFSGGVLTASAGSGSVNSSGGGYAITTLAGYADGTGNVIRAITMGTGVSIASGVLTLDGDLQSLASASSTNVLYYRSAADTWATVTIGTGLTFSGGTLSASASGGGNVSNIGTPVANQVAIWSNATTILGDTRLTWSGSVLGINGPAGGNNVNINGGASGITPTIQSTGTDAAIGLNYATKGSGPHSFYTNGLNNLQVRITHQVADVNNLILTGGDGQQNITMSNGSSPRTVTPAAASNDTSIATTAFVKTTVAGVSNKTTWGVRGLQGSSSISTLSVNAYEYLLRDSSGGSILIPGGAISVAPGAAVGANGPDAAIGATAEVNFYAIYGTSPGLAGICSVNNPPTGPLLPGGYTHWCYLTTIKRVSSNLATMIVRGDWAYYLGAQSILSNGNSGGAWTNVSSAAVVPVIALNVSLAITGSVIGSSTFNQLLHTVGPTSTNPMISFFVQAWAASITGYGFTTGIIPNVSQVIWYTYGSPFGTLTGSGMSMAIMGYQVPNSS